MALPEVMQGCGPGGSSKEEKGAGVVERAPREQRNGRQLAATQAPPLNEAALVQLWQGQRIPAAALVTQRGLPLRVLHPGWRGRGPGPDFRHAVIAPPAGRLLRGDVELHVRSSDFRVHGHGGDRAYNNVVLHLVFEDDGAEDTVLANGRRCPVVALAPWLRRRTEELAGWLAAPRLWREPCHDAIARLGPDAVLQELERLGDERFAAREAALARSARTLGAGEALYRALLEGISYGGQRTAPGHIAERLPWRELVLLHGSGLEVAFAAAGRAVVAGQPYRGRPGGDPARRLAGLGRLLARHEAKVGGLAAVDEQMLRLPAPALIARWGVAAPEGGPALIGRSRAIELLVNAVLPWAAAKGVLTGHEGLAQAARDCYPRLPRPATYGVLRFLEGNLREGRPLPIDARRQQGLLALYKSECTTGGCGRCALS
jgi:hypothetical protein